MIRRKDDAGGTVGISHRAFRMEGYGIWRWRGRTKTSPGTQPTTSRGDEYREPRIYDKRKSENARTAYRAAYRIRASSPRMRMTVLYSIQGALRAGHKCFGGGASGLVTCMAGA